jgi:hypothetical protein
MADRRRKPGGLNLSHQTGLFLRQEHGGLLPHQTGLTLILLLLVHPLLVLLLVHLLTTLTNLIRHYDLWTFDQDNLFFFHFQHGAWKRW